MFNDIARCGMIVLPITSEDVERSITQQQVFMVKRRVTMSLWSHPIIYSFLVDKNPTAVNALTNLRAQRGEVDQINGVAYHLVKQTASILEFLCKKIGQVLTSKLQSLGSSSNLSDLIEVTDSMCWYLDNLHYSVVNRRSYYVFTKEPQLKDFLQLWALMYVLANNERVP